MGRAATSNCIDDVVRKMELCRKWKEARSKEHEAGLHH